NTYHHSTASVTKNQGEAKSKLRRPSSAMPAALASSRDSNARRPGTPSKMTRRHFLTASAAGGFALASSPVAQPQAYPSRPITLVVAFPAGNSSDATARVLAEQMRGSLGQPVIIENVSGADGSIGTGRVARARPDGYTIQVGVTSTHMMNGAVYSLPYDVV